jgi:hypothetical protein
MTMTATYNGNEIEVTFVAQTERSDYGVPNSPVWDEVNPDTIEVQYLTILGLDVDISKLPKDLQGAIYELCNEVTFEEEL